VTDAQPNLGSSNPKELPQGPLEIQSTTFVAYGKESLRCQWIWRFRECGEKSCPRHWWAGRAFLFRTARFGMVAHWRRPNLWTVVWHETLVANYDGGVAAIQPVIWLDVFPLSGVIVRYAVKAWC
jgi:hypothetical protein